MTCHMAATGWWKIIRGPEKRMTARIFSRMAGLYQWTRQLAQNVFVSMNGQRSERLRA